jgi:hypothetical protein
MKRLLMILVVFAMVFGLMIVLPGVASADPGLCAGGILGAAVSDVQPEAARTFGKDANPTVLAGLGPYPIAPGLAGLCSPNPAGWQHYNPAKVCNPAHPLCPSP